jgi:EmrB/QacA subfamily drug resistance transporter
MQLGEGPDQPERAKPLASGGQDGQYLAVLAASKAHRRLAWRRWVGLIVLCLGQLMIVLDTTVVYVVLPTIQRELGFSSAALSWVVDAYLITFGGFLLVSGRLGDIVGHKRVFLLGVALFTVASGLCGLAETQLVLIGARLFQGLGAALTASVILGIVATEFELPHDRAVAVGVFGFVGVAGGALGLFLGGVISQAASWHWIFFVNVPIGVATVVLASLLIPGRQGARSRRSIDVWGAVLITASIMLLVYAIAGVDRYGWTSLPTIASLVGAIMLCCAFLVVEAVVSDPLLPRHATKSRALLHSNIIRGLLSVGMVGQFYLTVLYLEHVKHYDAIRAGLSYVPQASSIGILSLLITTRVMGRVGVRVTMVVGLALVACGIVWLSNLGPTSSYLFGVLPGVLLVGIGAGLAFTPTITVALATATPRDAGFVGALINMAQQLCSAVGLAVLATISAARTNTMLERGVAPPLALVRGYRYGYLLTFACLGLAVAMAAFWKTSTEP